MEESILVIMFRKFFKCAVACLVLCVMTCSSVSAMTDDQKEKCHYIIHGAATAAVASSALLSQAPGTDNMPLCIAVGGMAIALGNVFDYPFVGYAPLAVGTAIIADYATAIAVRFASQWVIGWIPFLGNAANSATAFALIEYIGWQLAEAYDTGDFLKIGKNLLVLLGKFFDAIEDGNEFKRKLDSIAPKPKDEPFWKKWS